MSPQGTTTPLALAAAVAVLVLASPSPGSAPEQQQPALGRPALRFRRPPASGAPQRFKIVQFSDLHLDSTGDQCANTSHCIALTQGVMR